MYIIAGLGNPGLKYRHTRHNAGFDAISCIGEQYGIRIRTDEFRAKTGKGTIEGKSVLLVKPQTYMNSSGDSIGEILRYYHADPVTDLIVLSDDIELPAGMIRIRKKGSAGGHNGLKSIIAAAGTDGFTRIRIGVGKLPAGGDMVKHVLGHLPAADRKAEEHAFEDVREALVMILGGETDRAMNRFNKRT